MTQQPDTTPTRRRRPRMKPGHLVALAVVFVACLALSYWQWTRFESGNGSFQNLGYAFQWPIYGVMAIILYRRTLAYEEELSETGQAPVEIEQQRAGEVRAIDEEFLPERPTIDVEEFNRMNTPRRRRVREEEQRF